MKMLIRKYDKIPVPKWLLVLLTVGCMAIGCRAMAMLPPFSLVHKAAGNLHNKQVYSGVGMWLLVSVLFTFFINWYISRKENKPD